RLARDAGAQTVTRPAFRRDKEPTVRDVEPLAGARAALDLELAARATARDYIRQAREAGHGWQPIGEAPGLHRSAPGRGEAAPPAPTCPSAAGGHEPAPPWEPRHFGWTCRSCDRPITDHGQVAGPADDEIGHAGGCGRHAAVIAEWDAQDARWAADWEAGQ